MGLAVTKSKTNSNIIEFRLTRVLLGVMEQYTKTDYHQPYLMPVLLSLQIDLFLVLGFGGKGDKFSLTTPLLGPICSTYEDMRYP